MATINTLAVNFCTQSAIFLEVRPLNGSRSRVVKPLPLRSSAPCNTNKNIKCNFRWNKMDVLRFNFKRRKDLFYTSPNATQKIPA